MRLLPIPHLHQQRLLPFCQIGWQDDVVSDNQVALRAVGQRAAFAAQTNLRARLRFGLHFQFQLRSACHLNDDFTAQQGRIKV
ncbi:MAG: hypothetical protein IKS94_02305, partial [Prevotella sp.]|nr:hypothetical protein [Prevotella sp.]